MSKFGWIFISYVLYVITLKIQDTIFLSNNKPILASGYMTSIGFASLVFLTTIILEIGVIIYQKSE